MSHSQGRKGCGPLLQFSEKTAQKPEDSLGSSSSMLSGNEGSPLDAWHLVEKENKRCVLCPPSHRLPQMPPLTPAIPSLAALATDPIRERLARNLTSAHNLYWKYY